MHRYVHVTVIYSSPVNDPRSLEPAITAAATDWIRYSANTWLLWTSQPLAQIAGRLRFYLRPDDHVLAMAMNPYDTPAGFMPQWIWDWLNRYRDPQNGYVNWPAPVAPPTLPVGNIFGNALTSRPMTGGLAAGNPLVDHFSGKPEPNKK